MSRATVIAAFIFPIMAALVMAALALGALLWQPPALLHSPNHPGCALPCWRGIYPGETTAADVAARLGTAIRPRYEYEDSWQAHTDGAAPGVGSMWLTFWRNGNVIVELSMGFTQPFRVGDLLAWLGAPDRVGLLPPYTGDLYYEKLGVRFSVPDVRFCEADDPRVLTPSSSVAAMEIAPRPAQWLDGFADEFIAAWKGFGAARYCAP